MPSIAPIQNRILELENQLDAITAAGEIHYNLQLLPFQHRLNDQK